MRRPNSTTRGLIVNGFGLVRPGTQGANPLSAGASTRRQANLTTQFGRNLKRGR